VVIFVTGTVTISGDITVPNGSFLAIITGGNITFGAATRNVAGVFIASGILTVNNASSVTPGGVDRQFKGEGIFAGLGGTNGVVLNRSLNSSGGDFDNNTDPAEKFTYRPDFLINAPDEFRKISVAWTEVEPVRQ
jgi:hypothetical protein